MQQSILAHLQSKPWGNAGDGPEKRKAIRETWLPRAKAQPGVEARFVVGRAGEDRVQESFLKQVDNHPDEFLLVSMLVCASSSSIALLSHTSVPGVHSCLLQLVHALTATPAPAPASYLALAW